jgi:folate-dependent phosphoribosylglycinamide formyltransferase PurN
MRTALIHHVDDDLNGDGLARWLGSFSDLAAILAIAEPRARLWKRIRREWRRSGPFRFLDVLAFRLYYKARLARADRVWEADALARLRADYPTVPPTTPRLVTSSPNSPEAEAFLRAAEPDLVIARCKSLLRKQVFTIPRNGTFVMHPGICPDYRNAHGCFWALAQGDFDNVGMTLLRIDEGVDTGPVFGHYRCSFDPSRDSHVVIQNKVVLDNLGVLQAKLLQIDRGEATPVDTSGRPSRAWGQPWLSAYLRWRRLARRTSERPLSSSLPRTHHRQPLMQPSDANGRLPAAATARRVAAQPRHSLRDPGLARHQRVGPRRVLFARRCRGRRRIGPDPAVHFGADHPDHHRGRLRGHRPIHDLPRDDGRPRGGSGAGVFSGPLPTGAGLERQEGAQGARRSGVSGGSSGAAESPVRLRARSRD